MVKFGVEIECLNKSSRAPSTSQLSRKISLDVRGWFVTRDGSINGYGLGEGYEVVSPPREYNEDSFEQIRKVCNILKDIQCGVNRSCGLHVHFDASELTRMNYMGILARYANLEPVLDGFFPQSRRKNTYCKPVKNHLNIGAARHSNMLYDRYRKVNSHAFNHHGTIEFRQHHGTIDADEIINWVKFLKNFIDVTCKVPITTIKKENISVFDEFIKKYDIGSIVRADARKAASYLATAHIHSVQKAENVLRNEKKRDVIKKLINSVLKEKNVAVDLSDVFEHKLLLLDLISTLNIFADEKKDLLYVANSDILEKDWDYDIPDDLKKYYMDKVKQYA